MGTALVGMIHDAAAFGVLTDDPHAEGGEDGEECEDEDGGHRVILNEKSNERLNANDAKKRILRIKFLYSAKFELSDRLPLEMKVFSTKHTNFHQD
ncbi:MAG: hypothetical protein OHK003_27650 [Anaerolineales bacterium]